MFPLSLINFFVFISVPWLPFARVFFFAMSVLTKLVWGCSGWLFFCWFFFVVLGGEVWFFFVFGFFSPDCYIEGIALMGYMPV